MDTEKTLTGTSVPNIEELLEAEKESAINHLFGLDDGSEHMSFASCKCNCQNDAVFATCGC